MKRLTLVRHAKSSWKERDLDDFERPLNERGGRDAPRMAARFAASAPAVDIVVASPANRAESTAEAFHEALRLPPERLRFERDLYLAPIGGMRDVVQSLDDAHDDVVLVGHNPGISELAELLCNAGIGHVPTCAVLRLELSVESWGDTTPGCAQLVDFDMPKHDA